MAMKHESRHPAALGRELQAPARQDRQGLRLAHHGRQSSAAQAFLHRPEDVAIRLGLGENEAPGRKTGTGEAPGIKIRSLETPEDRPLRPQPGENAGDESRRDCAILRCGTGAANIVQCPQGQAAGQGPIDRRDAESQAALRLPALRKRRGPLLECGKIHGFAPVRRLCCLFVLNQTEESSRAPLIGCPAPALRLDNNIPAFRTTSR